jgi:hypothetical protein
MNKKTIVEKFIQKRLGSDSIIIEKLSCIEESQFFTPDEHEIDYSEINLPDGIIPLHIFLIEGKGKESEKKKGRKGIYKGRSVLLNKPSRGDVKKFKVFVSNGKKDEKTGMVKAIKVNFGHGGSSAKAKGEKTMRINRQHPKNRKNFLKRHNCKTATDKTTPRYWSCKFGWRKKPLDI